MVSTAETPSIASKIRHLSWSKVQTYLQCPRRFAFHYLEDAPEERRSASLIFGGAIHRAIESIPEAKLAGQPTPTQAQLVDAYRQAWNEEVTESPVLHFSKGEDAGSLTDLAGRMLEAFLGHEKQDADHRQVIGIEHEAKFNLIADAPPVLARIDLLEISEHGSDLVVTDFKTAKCSWSESKVCESLPQVVIYAHAVLPILRELGAKRIVPRFVVLTKGKKPKVQVLTPTATQNDVTKLKQTVTDVWNSIQQGVFVRREGWQCAGCPFRDRCMKGGCGAGS